MPRMVRNSFRKSMWPPTADEAKAMKLDRCIRILPHHQVCWDGGTIAPPLMAPHPSCVLEKGTDTVEPSLQSSQDCGGFFVALLRKTAPLPGPEPLRAGLRTTESHPVASLDSRTPKGTCQAAYCSLSEFQHPGFCLHYYGYNDSCPSSRD